MAYKPSTRVLSIDDDVDLVHKSSNIYNSIQNDAFIRAKLLEKAEDYYHNKQEYESIYHQIEALCIGFRSKFKFSTKNLVTLDDQIKKMLEDMNRGMQRIKTNSIDAVPREISEFLPVFPEMTSSKRKPIEVEGLPPICTNKLLDDCRNLPKEWTVIQITKQFDPDVFLQTANEMLGSDKGIYLTLLKYPRMDLNDFKPISVFISPPKDGIFSRNAKISELIKETMKLKDVKMYANGLSLIDKSIKDVLDDMFLWLGPWVTLFIGEFKSSSVQIMESNIFDQIDDFCKMEKILDKRTRVLLSLIGRGIDLLNANDLESFSKALTTDGLSSEKLYKFLVNLKTKSKLSSVSSTNFPTILVVDELLDGFYWEMLLPSKEICRCSALHILMELFKKYSKQIKNGYLNLNVTKGTALINLGDDLPNMQKRITSFLDYWKPSWKKFIKRTPSESEIEEFLKASDVVVYSGHGSGQQFLNPEHIRQLNVNCLVFLFGCESVKLVSSGWCSERTGIHLFYHYILCPLIVGALTIITDIPTDQICVLSLSTWLKSEKENLKHMHYIDRKKFKDGSIEFSNVKLFKELTEENDPNLLNIFTKIRQISALSLWMRSTFVLRGLPVWNTN